jgi:hypothetical protein
MRKFREIRRSSLSEGGQPERALVSVHRGQADGRPELSVLRHRPPQSPAILPESLLKSLQFQRLGGRTRARTWDPLIKSQLGHSNQLTLRVVSGKLWLLGFPLILQCI